MFLFVRERFHPLGLAPFSAAYPALPCRAFKFSATRSVFLICGRTRLTRTDGGYNFSHEPASGSLRLSLQVWRSPLIEWRLRLAGKTSSTDSRRPGSFQRRIRS